MSHRHVLPLIAAAACWGLGAVASKRAVAELPPTVLLAVQLAASAAVLTFILRGSRRSPRTAGARLGLLGVLNPGLAYLLSLAGLASISAGLSVLLWALEPVFILFLAALLLGERIRPVTGVLSLGAVGGAALAGAAGTGGAQLQGVALTVAAVGCCAVYTVASASWMRAESPLAVVMVQQWCALGFAMAVLAVHLVGGGVQIAGVSAVAWASALGSGIIYYGLAFWAFLTGLRHTTAATAGVFLNLIPLFGIGAGRWLLGERMVLAQLVGAGIVVTTVAALVVAAPGPAQGAAPSGAGGRSAGGARAPGRSGRR